VAVALACGIGAALFTLHARGLAVAAGAPASDFAQVWTGARALLAGHDPYAVVGPGKAFDWPAPLLYPLPALLLALPVAWLPLWAAEMTFVGASVAALAFALTRAAWWPLLALASGAALYSYQVVQWAPLVTVAALVPWAGALAVAKPTIGLAVLAYRPRPVALASAALLLGVSLVVMPAWPLAWWAALHAPWDASMAGGAAVTATGGMYRALVMQPGGVLALAALARWRRPEARVLVALACVPITLLPYDLLPLALVCRRRVELLAFGVGTALVTAVRWLPAPHERASFTRVGLSLVWLVVLPLVVLVLRRPNVAPEHDTQGV
jgi:hypothetical protein